MVRLIPVVPLCPLYGLEKMGKIGRGIGGQGERRPHKRSWGWLACALAACYNGSIVLGLIFPYELYAARYSF